MSPLFLSALKNTKRTENLLINSSDLQKSWDWLSIAMRFIRDYFWDYLYLYFETSTIIFKLKLFSHIYCILFTIILKQNKNKLFWVTVLYIHIVNFNPCYTLPRYQPHKTLLLPQKGFRGDEFITIIWNPVALFLALSKIKLPPWAQGNGQWSWFMNLSLININRSKYSTA